MKANNDKSKINWEKLENFSYLDLKDGLIEDFNPSDLILQS